MTTPRQDSTRDRDDGERRFADWVADGKTDALLAHVRSLRAAVEHALVEQRTPDRLEYAARSAFHVAELQRRRRDRWRTVARRAAVLQRRSTLGTWLVALVALLISVAAGWFCVVAWQATDAAEVRAGESRAAAERARDAAVASATEASQREAGAREEHRMQLAAANAYALLGEAMPTSLTLAGAVGSDASEPAAWRAIRYLGDVKPEHRPPLIRLLLQSFPLRLPPAPTSNTVYNLRTAAFGPGEQILVADNTGRLSSLAWAETGARPAWTFPIDPGGNLGTLQFAVSEGGNRAVVSAVSTNTRGVKTWTAADLGGSSAPTALDGAVEAATLVAISRDGTKVATISNRALAVAEVTADGNAGPPRRFELASLSLPSRAQDPKSATFSADGAWLAVVYSRLAVLHSLESAQRSIPLAEGKPVSSVALSPDARWVATIASGAQRRVEIDTLPPTPRNRETPPPVLLAGAIEEVMFLNAQTLAVRTNEAVLTFVVTAPTQAGAAAVWNRGIQRTVVEVRAPTRPGPERRVVERLVLRPERDREVLRCFDDGSIDLWNVARDEVRPMLHSHASSIASASFSADGTRLVTIERADTASVHLWILEPSAASVEYYAKNPGELIGGLPR